MLTINLHCLNCGKKKKYARDTPIGMLQEPPFCNKDCKSVHETSVRVPVTESKPKLEYDTRSQAENKYGQYVPAIPEPYWVGWGLKKAECWTCAGRPVFKNETQYRGHYALVHILGL